MKAGQLAEFLNEGSKLIGAAGSGRVAACLERIAAAISRGGNQQASKFFGVLESSCEAPRTNDTPELRLIVPVVERMIDLLAKAGAKKAVLTDLQLLLDVMRRQGQLSIADFDSASARAVASASKGKGKPGAQPVDKRPIIEDYLRRLEDCLGIDREFQSVYLALSVDELVDRAAVVTIASQFVAHTAPSTSRPKALHKIMSRHERLLTSRAASSSIGGKAA